MRPFQTEKRNVTLKTVCLIFGLAIRIDAATIIVSGQFSANFPVEAPVSSLSGEFSTQIFDVGERVTLQSFQLNPSSIGGTQFDLANVNLMILFNSEMEAERVFIGGGTRGSRLSGDVDFRFRRFADTYPYNPGIIDADLYTSTDGVISGTDVTFSLTVHQIPEPSVPLLLAFGVAPIILCFRLRSGKSRLTDAMSR